MFASLLGADFASLRWVYPIVNVLGPLTGGCSCVEGVGSHQRRFIKKGVGGETVVKLRETVVKRSINVGKLRENVVKRSKT